jgi:hypothetical protein
MLSEFSRAFAECLRIDSSLLDLAVKNTNLKAYNLAFGPAAEALGEMDGALARMIAAYAASDSPEGKRAMLLAAGAQSGALRIQSLLPPHIAQASETRMDELESKMAEEDQTIRLNLAELATINGPSGRGDLAAASAAYDRFGGIRKEILLLSRENTNVRSLDLSLNQKRAAVLQSQEALAALERAVKAESVTPPAPQSPR